MIPLKHILLPTDCSDGTIDCLAFAFHLAERFGADLHLLHASVPTPHEPGCEPSQYPLSDEELTRQLAQVPPEADGVEGSRQAAEQLQVRAAPAEHGPEVLRDLRVGSVRILQAQVEVTDAASAILEYAETHAIDLILMSTHGRRRVARILEGSVAEEVVHSAACPVLTAHAEEGIETLRSAGRILIATGQSDRFSLAARYAALLVDAPEMLHLLHLVDVRSTVGKDARGAAPVHIENGQAMNELARELRAEGLSAEWHVEAGHPAHEILAFTTQHKIDLIVNAVGEDPSRIRPLSSVSGKVIRRAPCPVLTLGGTSASD